MMFQEAAKDGDKATNASEAFKVETEDVWATIDRMSDSFIAALPKIGVAIVIFAVFCLIAWGVKKLVRKYTESHPSAHIGQVMGRLSQWAIILVGLMVAVGVVAPSVTPAKFLGALGVGGVAVGFAFKDILQNFMAGLIILVRQPFSVGDQVVFGDHEGTVEDIDTRNTVLKTYDSRRVLIPNGQVYTNPMQVLTAHDARRTQYDVGIGYGDDIEKAREAMLDAVRNCEGVLSDPAPEVLVVELAGSSVNLRARWWTKPERADVVHTSDRVISAIKKRLDEEHVDMPYPTNVVLFHDQTEETDGDRTRQREGWPVGEEAPEPMTIAGTLRDSRPSESNGSEDRGRNGRNGNLESRRENGHAMV